MDIRVIKNSENSSFESFGENLLLQTVDGNFEYLNYKGKKMYVLNTTNNERFEITPEIKKYDIGKFVYATEKRNYMMFSSLDSVTDSKTAITVYRFIIDDNESIPAAHIEIDNDYLLDSDTVTYYVLDSNYFFVQLLDKDNSLKSIFLHDINQNINYDLRDSIIGKLGIYKLFPASGNFSVIKLGKDKDIDLMKGTEEIVGLINPKQLASEITFNSSDITIEELERADDSSTFPYIKNIGNKVIFSKYSKENKSEEIIIYDKKTKIKQVRLNSNIEKNSDLSYTYVINDIPYTIKNDNDETVLINLNTQKEELVLPKGMVFHYLMDNFIVITHYRFRIPLIKCGSPYIEVHRIDNIEEPLIHPLLKIKGEFKSCLINVEDLIIFIS